MLKSSGSSGRRECYEIFMANSQYPSFKPRKDGTGRVWPLMVAKSKAFKVFPKFAAQNRSDMLESGTDSPLWNPAGRAR